MVDSTGIAVIGAGVIGRRHVGADTRPPRLPHVAGVADPSAAAQV